MSSPSSCPTPKQVARPKKMDWGGALHPRKILAIPSLFCLMWRILWAKLNSSDKSPQPRDHAWARDTLRKFQRPLYAVSMLSPDGGLDHCINALYLVLRIGDTIEDDTGKSAATRRADLANIHHFLDDPDYQPSCEYGVNQKELDLMRNLPRVRAYCAQLSPSSRILISDCCRSMCEGMEGFLRDERDDPFLIKDFHELEVYSYTATGVPFNGISTFFVAQGYESEDIIPTKTPFTGDTDWELDSGYPLFMHESHVIVGVASDTFASPQSRFYWPKSLVQKYVKDQRELFLPGNEQLALDCLNEFIIHTLRHILPALSWLVQNNCLFKLNLHPMIFLHFLTTLTLFYNNPDAFRFKLKSNFVELLYALANCQDFESLVQQTKTYCGKILEKSGPNDKHRWELEKVVGQILSGCDILLRKERRAKSVQILNSNDIFWWGIIFICALYCFMN